MNELSKTDVRNNLCLILNTVLKIVQFAQCCPVLFVYDKHTLLHFLQLPGHSRVPTLYTGPRRGYLEFVILVF